MNEFSNERQKNSGWGLIIGLMVTLIGVAFFFIGRNYLFSGTSLPKFNINLTVIMVGFFVALVINLVLSAIGFLFARKYQWNIILWLDNRLFPQVERRKKPRPDRALVKALSKINPEEALRNEETAKNYGCFDSVAGEEFLGPLFFKSWVAETAWRTFWYAIKISLSLSVIIALSSLFTWVVALPLSLLTFFSMILFYWKEEWKRMVGFFMITNHRYGWAEGQFSWTGLLFNRGFDVLFQEKSLSMIASVNIDPVPKNIRIGKLYEMFLEILAESQSNRLGTVSIDNITKTDSIVLANFSFAPYIYSLINSAREAFDGLQGQLALIYGTADRYLIGDPEGRQGNFSGREQKANQWLEQQKLRLNMTSSQEVNVFAMHTAYIRRLAGLEEDSFSEEVSSPNSSITKFPGVEINLPKTQVFPDDPIV